MTVANDILTNDYLDKARVLVISMIVAVALNAGIVVLLDSISISEAQNAPPLFSVSVPPSRGPIILGPVTSLPDHSIIPLFVSYSVTLHTNFTPFPAPPNPGKLERPLQHFHDDPQNSINCPFCQPLGKLTSVTSLSFGN